MNYALISVNNLRLFALILAFSYGIYASDEGTLPRLGINKKYFGNVSAVEERLEGHDISLNCEYYKSNSEVGRPTLEWYHNGNKIKEKTTDKRVYVLELSRNEHVSIILTLKNLLSGTDEGEYECRATPGDGSPTMSRKLKLEVIKGARWRNKDTVAAASIDEPLIVDCEADSDPKPYISVELVNNAGMPERYQLDGNKVKINSLALEDRNNEIKCTASQVLENHDLNPVVVKYVTIDVYYSPQFEGGEQTTRYGILGRNVSIPCRVIDSNPNPQTFEFFEHTSEPESNYPSTYPVTVSLLTRSAFLYIPKVEDDHFTKTYECVASNGKHRSSQKIILEKTNPPNIPRVAQLGVKEDYVVKWSIEDDKPMENDLPIIKYRVKYLEESKLGQASNNASNPLWNLAKEVEFLKVSSNVYKIDGLRKNTRYGFRFQSVNEAGSSDWSQSYVTLVSTEQPNAASSSRFLSTTFWSAINLLPHLVVTVFLRHFSVAGH